MDSLGDIDEPVDCFTEYAVLNNWFGKGVLWKSRDYVTSCAAVLGTGLYSAYTLFKAGVSLFTKPLAIALAAEGHDIQANCIGPGMFATDINKMADEIGPAFKQFVLSKIPMKHPPQPAAIKCLVVFLASKASSYITGQDIYIDGGGLANGA